MRRTLTLQNKDGAEVVLAGGILGLAEDGTTVRSFLDANPVDGILLGVPFEDLDRIRATTGHETTVSFDKDTTDELFIERLGKFGKTQIPPPDLYAAFDWAHQRHLPIEAIDLGDEGHSDVWTKKVGMFELMRNNRRLKKLGEFPFHAKTANDFALEWDEAIFPTKGLKEVQGERERHMAARIQDMTKEEGRIFALVPLARWNGVHRYLLHHGFADEKAPLPAAH